MFRKLMHLLALVTVFALVLSIAPVSAQEEVTDKWCAGKTIRFFVGGAEGRRLRGRLCTRGAAAGRRATWGPTVSYRLLPGWDPVS